MQMRRSFAGLSPGATKIRNWDLGRGVLKLIFARRSKASYPLLVVLGTGLQRVDPKPLWGISVGLDRLP